MWFRWTMIAGMLPLLAVAGALAQEVPMSRTAVAPAAAPDAANPLLQEWDTPYGLPPFDRIREEHFLPALQAGIEAHRQEVLHIARQRQRPTFQNTIEALDGTGRLLEKVHLVFQNLLGAETTPGLQAIAQQAAPLVAALQDDIFLHEGLFRRVQAVHRQRDRLGLDPVQRRLVEETYKQFVRAGARLDPRGKKRLREIHQELSTLGLRFGDNLLAANNAYRLVIDRPEDLAGLPPQVVAGAAAAAKAAGLEGRFVFTLHWPSLWPFLQYSERRDLRREILEAYASRCLAEGDNRPLIRRMVALRAEKARLLGHPTWAHFVLDDRMARTPDQVRGLLDRVRGPALAAARRDAATYQALAREAGQQEPLAPWDWRFYAEKVRARRFGLDETRLRPYFALDQVLQGVFTVANRLYGISFTEKTGIPLYSPEVRLFEVTDGDGSFLGVLLTDFFPRPGKRGGAWAGRYRSQAIVDGQDIRPIGVIVGNFTRPTGEDPALLSLDEAETLFHEMGHALHVLLAQVPYRTLAGVPRDFVELPSQILENWLLHPEVLPLYARHYQTGEPLPEDLVQTLEQARRFDQGFATTEYLAAAYLDMAWHLLPDGRVEDVEAFEARALQDFGLIPAILPRYRSTYFQHIFGGGGSYSAGYYSYLWSEVLDADAFAAFAERGVFDRDLARAFRTEILEKGGTVEASEMYRRFRGRDPVVEPLLQRRGLLPLPEETLAP